MHHVAFNDALSILGEGVVLVFKGPGGFGRIMNISMNAFMSLAFSFIMLWVAQQRVPEGVQVLTPTAYFVSVLTAFGIGYVVIDLIPVFKLGNGLAKKLGLKGIGAYAATVVVIDLVVTTIIGFLMTLMNMISHATLAETCLAWLTTYPLMLIVGFAIQLVIMKPFMMLAQKISGFDPYNPEVFYRP